MSTRKADDPGGATRPRRIEYVPITEVQTALRNPKAHDIAHIKALIGRFGFVGSAVHDGRTGRIIAGHGRLESLVAMASEDQAPPDGIVLVEGGAWAMPVEYGWSSRSDSEAEALGAALNEATTRGGWDEQALAGMLRDLDGVDADLRRLAGWDDGQFASLVASLGSLDGDDTVPGAPEDREEPTPPEDFPSYDDDIPTEHTCPKCGYEWSGGSGAA